MEIYRTKSQSFFSIGIVITVILAPLIVSGQDIGILGFLVIGVGSLSMTIVLVWLYLVTLVVSDINITQALIFQGKTLWILKTLEWGDVWKIDYRSNGPSIILVPRREKRKPNYYRPDELFIIGSNYANQLKILESIVKKVPDAELQESVKKLLSSGKSEN